MKTAKLNISLRNYLIANKIPLIFIDFEKSLIKDGKGYQALVLIKPNSCAFEVEPLEWKYTAEKVLLYFNCSSEKVTLIPLCFTAKFAGRDAADELDFTEYSSIKISENHIMIITIGREFHGDSKCCDVALFATNGELVSVWKMENVCGYKTTIQNFHQVKTGYWLVKFEIDRDEQYEPVVKRLCLFTENEAKAISLSLAEHWNPSVGSLPGSESNDISCWFGEEVDDKPHFFVLASCYQCCIYRRLKARDKNYEKIADISLKRSFIDYVDVKLTDKGITVKFDSRRTLIKSGSFHLSFEN